jgi:hypothetical protein
MRRFNAVSTIVRQLQQIEKVNIILTWWWSFVVAVEKLVLLQNNVTPQQAIAPSPFLLLYYRNRSPFNLTVTKWFPHRNATTPARLLIQSFHEFRSLRDAGKHQTTICFWFWTKYHSANIRRNLVCKKTFTKNTTRGWQERHLRIFTFKHNQQEQLHG